MAYPDRVLSKQSQWLWLDISLTLMEDQRFWEFYYQQKTLPVCTARDGTGQNEEWLWGAEPHTQRPGGGGGYYCPSRSRGQSIWPEMIILRPWTQMKFPRWVSDLLGTTNPFISPFWKGNVYLMAVPLLYMERNFDPGHAIYSLTWFRMRFGTLSWCRMDWSSWGCWDGVNVFCMWAKHEFWETRGKIIYWVELYFHKRYVQVLTLGSCEFDFIWK